MKYTTDNGSSNERIREPPVVWNAASSLWLDLLLDQELSMFFGSSTVILLVFRKGVLRCRPHHIDARVCISLLRLPHSRQILLLYSVYFPPYPETVIMDDSAIKSLQPTYYGSTDTEKNALRIAILRAELKSKLLVRHFSYNFNDALGLQHVVSSPFSISCFQAECSPPLLKPGWRSRLCVTLGAPQGRSQRPGFKAVGRGRVSLHTGMGGILLGHDPRGIGDPDNAAAS